MCARAAECVRDFPVLVLPPIWWGLSPYWMRFPGTLTLSPETLVALIADLARSVAGHGVRRLVVVNGHGGNDGLIQAAAIKASIGDPSGRRGVVLDPDPGCAGGSLRA